MVWALGRIYCTGMREDYAAVHALQHQVSLVPRNAMDSLTPRRNTQWTGCYWIGAWHNLKHNVDGSVDLYVQRDPPGADRE
jgi:hypothetical protein